MMLYLKPKINIYLTWNDTTLETIIFNEPLPNTTTLGLIRLSVFKSKFKITERKYKFADRVKEYNSFKADSTGGISLI